MHSQNQGFRIDIHLNILPRSISRLQLCQSLDFLDTKAWVLTLIVGPVNLLPEMLGCDLPMSRQESSLVNTGVGTHLLTFKVGVIR